MWDLGKYSMGGMSVFDELSAPRARRMFFDKPIELSYEPRSQYVIKATKQRGINLEISLKKEICDIVETPFP